MKQTNWKFNHKTRMAIKPDGTQIPYLDGTFSFLVMPNQDDIKNGIPGSHTECMYCLCCRRQYGSDVVIVTRLFAYVELRGKGGRLELRRFELSDPAKVAIGDFDSERDVTPEAVVFAAPSKHRRLDAQNAAYRKWLQNSKKPKKAGQTKKPYIKGTIPRNREIKKFSMLRDPASGLFQFRTPANAT